MTQQEIAHALHTLDPKAPFLPEFHAALLRFVVSVVVEAIALRRIDGRLYARLRQRQLNEPAYPGFYHFPGSFYRVEESTTDVMARLATHEFQAVITKWDFINHLIRKEERGTVCSLLFLVDLENDTADDQWFPVDELPEPMVKDHRTDMLPMAIRFFEEREGRELLDRER